MIKLCRIYVVTWVEYLGITITTLIYYHILSNDINKCWGQSLPKFYIEARNLSIYADVP